MLRRNIPQTDEELKPGVMKAYVTFSEQFNTGREANETNGDRSLTQIEMS